MGGIQRLVSKKQVGAWVISGLGIALAGLSLWYLLVVRALRFPTSAGYWGVFLQGLELVLLAAFSLVLVYAGYWLASSPFETNRVWWAGLWTLIGLAGIIAIVALISSLQFVYGRELPEPTLVQTMLLAAGGGAFAGLLIGISTVRETTEAERARRQRDTLEFTNELLRHNVLNGMQVIIGNSKRLDAHVDEEGEAYLELIRDRSERIVGLIQNVRALMDSISGEVPLETVTLSQVLEHTVSEADATYEDATFDADIPDGIEVHADSLLDAVFENLLANAVEHNDTDHPRVEVSVEESAETVLVRIADNGPGIPDAKRESCFDPGEQSDESVGQGLGLHLVDTLVTRYDGAVWIENNDPRGTIVVVELQRTGPSH